MNIFKRFLDAIKKLFTKSTIENESIQYTKTDPENPTIQSICTEHANCSSKNNEIISYFVFGRDMEILDIDLLSSIGVNTIFLNYYAIDKFGHEAVNNWIASVPQDVYIWVQCFNNGTWIHPLDIDLQSRVDSLMEYDVQYSAGFLLDYLRRPGDAYKRDGTTEAITEFVERFDTVTDKKLIACVMPEKSDEYYYGQDIEAISNHVDNITAMVYKGNYKQPSSWITSTSQWMQQACTGCQFFATLQSYVSDDDTTVLSEEELRNDVECAYNGLSDGIAIFRYGISSFPDLRR